MLNEPLLTSDRDEILRAIRHVRNRWRLRVALRGIAVLVAASIGTLFISSYGLEIFKFSAISIVTFRILTYVALFGSGWWFFIRPIFRYVSDERVALYLEEHEPSMQAAVLSAVEETKKGDRGRGANHSPELVRQLIVSAVNKIHDIDMGRTVEQRQLKQSSGLLFTVSFAAVLLFLFGPTYLWHGITALLMPIGSIEAANPYQIEVLPGDVMVARGADQTITAHLLGFESDEVDLFMRSGGSSKSFEQLPFVPIENEDGEVEIGMYEVHLFDLQETTKYFVESVGVESVTYTLDVIDLPYVERLELEYHFPEYTGLEPRSVEEGGDIAVLMGTEVKLRAFSTIKTAGGQLVFDDSDDSSLDLIVDQDGVLTTSFVVEQEGFYRVDLQSPDGQLVLASPQYTIDVLTDQPPSVMFVRPGRDTTASAIEEIFVEARADDDFGLHSLGLVYSVNGGPEQTRSLFKGSNNVLKEVSAGHTFFLEEFELEPGDFLSYYATSTDRNLAKQNSDVKSDLYFIQIRRYSQDFREQQSQGNASMGGGGDARALSEAQREIISATFNLLRDQETYTHEEFQENLVFLTLTQGRLREQVDTLLRRMNSRAMSSDPAFQKIQDTLLQAADAMRVAEEKLQEQAADKALPHEQRSLKFLQRAEEVYEEVIVTQGGGGGGGGGGRQAAEDLADLFELELDKMRNQYETMQRGQQEQADNTIDELMERLRELARRQEREAERQRRRARGQLSTQGGGAGQRALAEEAEEAARRLERLAREQNSTQMRDAARRLQEAADAMKRAAANNDNLGFTEAGTALDRLRDVQERLNSEQSGRLKRDIEDQLRRVNRLADEQREMASDVGGLDGISDQKRMEELRRLMEQKDQMESKVADLERDIDSTSAEFHRDERNAARELQEAAAGIRDNKLKEKIRYSKGLIRSRPGDTADAFESEIGSDIEELAEQLEHAAATVGQSEVDRITQALNQTRDLMRSLESLDHRIWEEGQELADSQQTQQNENPSGDRRPGMNAWESNDIRQWSREFQQRANEAQELRRLLEQENFKADDLDTIIQQMRELDNLRIYQDPNEVAQLQTSVLEELKRFEYRLRREVNIESEELFLASSDEVPPGFRDLIEEYYRVLSKDE